VSKYSIGNLKVVSIIRFFIFKNISKNALFYQKTRSKKQEARSKKQEARSKKKKGGVKGEPLVLLRV
jgi:hypothetical protein